MSIPLTLTVRRGGTDYTYTDVELLQRGADVVRRVSDLKIELDAISLWVGRGSGSASEVAGYTDPVALPSGNRHRARLARIDTNETVLNGALVTDDLEYEQRLDAWKVTLLNQAPRQFWDTLESKFFGDISQTAIENRVVKTWRRDEDNAFENPGEPEFRKSTVFGYRFMDVLDEIFRQLGFSRSLPPKLYAEPDGTFQSGTDNVWVSIPRWRLSTCIEQLCGFAGFRIVPQYESFPDTSLHVDLEPTTYGQPSVPAIDADLLAEGVRLRTREAEWEALQYANPVAEASPNPLEYGIIDETSDKSSYDTSFKMQTFATPPAWAMHGSAHWRADPAFRPGKLRPVADPRSFRSEVEDLRLSAPPVIPDTSTALGKAGRLLLPDTAFSGFVSYDPNGRIDQPKEDEKAYIFSVIADPNSSDYLGLWGEVDESAYDGGVHATHWVRDAHRQQRQRREVIRELRGEYHTGADFAVGTRDGVEVEGKKWVVEEQRHAFEDDVNDLQLRRPATDTDRVLPTVANTTVWAVMRLEAKIVTINRGNGKEDWLLAHWERTATESCREYKYDVRYEDESDNQVSTEVFATAFTYQLASAGNGGQSYSDKTVEVRPVADSATGVYESVTA